MWDSFITVQYSLPPWSSSIFSREETCIPVNLCQQLCIQASVAYNPETFLSPNRKLAVKTKGMKICYCIWRKFFWRFLKSAMLGTEPPNSWSKMNKERRVFRMFVYFEVSLGSFILGTGFKCSNAHTLLLPWISLTELYEWIIKSNSCDTMTSDSLDSST